MAEGRIFYVIGPSGSGKDSVMRYAREQLAANPNVVFAHRYITRPVETQGENHIALSEAEFDARLEAGLFAMHWNSHGLRYGIGREISLWLNRGCNVVINGSREYLAQAREHYPELIAVMVSVSQEVLAERLRHRGRESEHQIAERIQRAALFNHPNIPIEVIRNDRELAEAGSHFIKLLTNYIQLNI
jgi:ribose 1,5-bisphosphokinase